MDINQTISLGIGAPAGVTEFLTLGLQIGEEVDVYEQTYAADVAIRQTANANAAIRQTMTSAVEL